MDIRINCWSITRIIAISITVETNLIVLKVYSDNFLVKFGKRKCNPLSPDRMQSEKKETPKIVQDCRVQIE